MFSMVLNTFFFLVGKMTYVFFYGFEYVLFMVLKTTFDFRVSLSQTPFPTTEPDFEVKLLKKEKQKLANEASTTVCLL